MDKNVKILLLSLGVVAGIALLVWAIVWHGFEATQDTGWVYHPQARVRDELLMDDPEINRLEVIKTFRQLRNRMALDTTPWQRARQHVHVTDMQEELLVLLNDIYRRLDRGEEIEEIARAVDDE